jgi:hypothetical protein
MKLDPRSTGGAWPLMRGCRSRFSGTADVLSNCISKWKDLIKLFLISKKRNRSTDDDRESGGKWRMNVTLNLYSVGKSWPTDVFT